MLMRDKGTEINVQSQIIKKYEELDLRSRFMTDATNDKVKHLRGVYVGIRNEFLELNIDMYEVVDILIEYLYKYKPTSFKTTLWECFGDVIVENLKTNVKQPLGNEWIMCEVCGKRVNYYNNRKYCDDCAEEKQKEWQRASMKKARNRQNV